MVSGLSTRYATHTLKGNINKNPTKGIKEFTLQLFYKNLWKKNKKKDYPILNIEQSIEIVSSF